jgi:hypothetical protein
MWGNIIIGGGIGAIVDHNNGSAYDYPDVVRIPMRKGASSLEGEASALK